jgi:hypothetical protein
MLYTAVFIFVAIAAFVVVNNLQSSEVPFHQNTLAKETGDGFVNSLTLAVKGGQGFSYNYSFPKTLYARPYKIDFGNINAENSSIIINYVGDYSNFSYMYPVPGYKYVVVTSGHCLSSSVLESNVCSNVLMLNNDGENLTITQLP